MTTASLGSAISTGLTSQFSCAIGPRGEIRVRTPWSRPDGEVVEVFVVERPSDFLVTDYGDTLGWLFSTHNIETFSETQKAQVDVVVDSLSLHLHNGQLTAECESVSDVAPRVWDIAQASIRIADLALKVRPPKDSVNPSALDRK